MKASLLTTLLAVGTLTFASGQTKTAAVTWAPTEGVCAFCTGPAVWQHVMEDCLWRLPQAPVQTMLCDVTPSPRALL
ncbi:MAG: hypothetical protein EOO77_30755 [Oxalobacteraceae bacterium]|nr:MAG: hypothetical protein EOO77_30755 [Oxalobacteraceae bacterium]